MVSGEKILLAPPLMPWVSPTGKWWPAATCQHREAAALSSLAGRQEQLTAAFVCRAEKRGGESAELSGSVWASRKIWEQKYLFQ